jgi:hypothetical protein
MEGECTWCCESSRSVAIPSNLSMIDVLKKRKAITHDSTRATNVKPKDAGYLWWRTNVLASTRV